MNKRKKKTIIAVVAVVVVLVIGNLAFHLTKDSSTGVKLTLDQKSCEIINPVFPVSGKVSDSQEPTEIIYSVTSEIDSYETVSGGYMIFEGNEWSTEINLKPGNNRIVFKAMQNGSSATKELNVNYDIGKPYELNPANIVLDEESDQEYVNNIIPVIFDTDATQQEIQSVAELCGGEIDGRIDFFYHIRVKENSYSELQKICDRINEMDCVQSAFVDTVIDLEADAFIPNDPWGGKVSWEENGADGINWGLEAIDAPDAWAYKDEFEDLPVAVADSGFDTEHEDLAGVLFPSFNHTNDLGYQDTAKNKYVLVDHGTHVAGTVGAIADNGKGVTGVIPNAKIYYTDVFQNSPSTTSSDMINALIYSVQSGAKVVNYSIGHTPYIEYQGYLDGKLEKYFKRAPAFDFTAINAANAMNNLLSQGYDFIVVQSAGNGAVVETSPNRLEAISIDASHNGHWASVSAETLMHTNFTDAQKIAILDRIITVGAAELTKNGTYQQAYFSNTGTNVDIYAPGCDIYSSAIGNKYASLDGTSMAAPHVTGVCGLTWSANPGLTGAEVKKIICSSTKDTVYINPNYTHRLTDTYRMVNAKLSVEAALSKKPSQNGNYSSVVRDSQTKLPIPGVSVEAYNFNTNELVTSATTDGNGNFALNLSVGTYLIKFNRSGYIEASTLAIASSSYVNRKDAIYMQSGTQTTPPTAEPTTEITTQPTTGAPSSDSVGYEMREIQFSRKAPDGTVYENVTVSYPYIPGDSSIAQTFQLLFEKKYSLDMTNSEKNDSDYYNHDRAKRYAEDNNLSFPVETHKDISVVYNKNGFISVKETEPQGYESTAEATPYYSTYNISTGNKATVTDFIKGSERQINALLSKHSNNTTEDIFADGVYTEVGLTDSGVCIQVFTVDLVASTHYITVPYTSIDSPVIFADKAADTTQ